MPSGNMSYVSENKITNITKKSGDDSDEKTRKKGSNFRRYFREYCDNSSIHGFKYLAEKKVTIRKF
ncbi:hypothetical protein NQ318_015337 [Aromia moschata]|uniref:Uncharacterized protein n=1 Tax=Aromia moschata TaxID=1265417 RepID=A0AAV8X904_9CUCU|nr:hypothetical protein NQ318_015337 [Aromia moschata]